MKTIDFEDMSQEIVEITLTRLSALPVVGDALEAMSVEDYDKLEEMLFDVTLSKLELSQNDE
jgi:hypothetical protein